MSEPHAFIVDGPGRYEQAVDLATRQAEIRRAIADRYTERLAAAGWLQRAFLKWQMRREVRRECEQLEPSPYSQWSILALA